MVWLKHSEFQADSLALLNNDIFGITNSGQLYNMKQQFEVPWEYDNGNYFICASNYLYVVIDRSEQTIIYVKKDTWENIIFDNLNILKNVRTNNGNLYLVYNQQVVNFNDNLEYLTTFTSDKIIMDFCCNQQFLTYITPEGLMYNLNFNFEVITEGIILEPSTDLILGSDSQKIVTINNDTHYLTFWYTSLFPYSGYSSGIDYANSLFIFNQDVYYRTDNSVNKNNINLNLNQPNNSDNKQNIIVTQNGVYTTSGGIVYEYPFLTNNTNMEIIIVLSVFLLILCFIAFFI